MWTGKEKILGQKVNVKFFTVDPYSVGTRVSRTFFKIAQNSEKYIFKNKNVNKKNMKKYI